MSIIIIFQEKMRFRKINQHDQGQTATECWSWDLNPGLSDTRGHQCCYDSWISGIKIYMQLIDGNTVKFK